MRTESAACVMKLIGGLAEASADVRLALQALPDVHRSDLIADELSKIASNLEQAFDHALAALNRLDALAKAKEGAK